MEASTMMMFFGFVQLLFTGLLAVFGVALKMVWDRLRKADEDTEKIRDLLIQIKDDIGEKYATKSELDHYVQREHITAYVYQAMYPQPQPPPQPPGSVPPVVY